MKKNNYNWKLNSEKLSQEQIDSHKDFDQLLKNFNNSTSQVPHRAPQIRRLYYYGSIAAAAIIGLLFFFGTNDNVDNNDITTFKEYASTMPYINPPLGGQMQAKFASQQVKAHEGGVYEFENGSKLTVPPAAFAYGNGGIVNGEVDIRFREYHDFVDFFLSGIPMEYDSAGTQYNLESAGMVEIYAEQNGERLNMAPGKSIEVELVSSVNVKKGEALPAFNIYYLDTEKRNWVYEGPDQMTRLEEEESASELLAEETSIENGFQEELEKIKQDQNSKLAAIEASTPTPIPPSKPQKANGSGQVFDFAFEDDQIDYGTRVPNSNQEEMRVADQQIRQLRSQYANTMWQISPKNVDFSDAAVKQVTWDDMKLKYDSGQDYKLTLIKGDQTLSFFVNPVLTGENFEAAMAEFNAKQASYERQIAERQAFMAEKIAEMKAAAAEEERLAELAYEERIAAYKAKGLNHRVTDEMIQAKVVNRFSARSLGIWNCDRPLPPAMFALKCSFKGKDDTNYNQNIAYLVDKNRNTVSRFFTKAGCKMDVNISSENLLWLVTADNKIAVHPPEDFKNLKKKTASSQERFDHTFVMNLVDQPIDTEEDIRRILDF